MGAALHLAYAYQEPPRRRKRKGGGGDDGGDGPFLIVPRDACEACLQHWHHRCWGADLLLPDAERPDCPCPCGDPSDPTGQRMSTPAWADLAQHDPAMVPQAVTGQLLRDGVGVFLCVQEDGHGLRAYSRRRDEP